MKPCFLIRHHSLTKDGQTVSWSGIREYHIHTNKWHDIGYHYGLETVGSRYEILKGRMDDENGAHCMGFNDKSLGICRVGNFNLFAPDEEGTILEVALYRSLMRIHDIPVEHVLGHWETYKWRNVPITKTCPGVKANMDDFRRLL